MRILVCSDIHANLVALQAVIADAGKFERIWCLGDIVGYGPEPCACIETLRRYDLVCMAGNHDWAVIDNLDLDEFNLDARTAALWTRTQLSVNDLEWLSALAENPVEIDRFTLCHGSPRHPIWEYVLTSTVARENFEHFKTPVCLVGHSHIPLVFALDSWSGAVATRRLMQDVVIPLGSTRMIINPGSVGQPRDGDTRAAYAILDTDASTLTHRRVAYDVSATQARMDEFGLPPRLVQRLSYGM